MWTQQEVNGAVDYIQGHPHRPDSVNPVLKATVNSLIAQFKQAPDGTVHLKDFVLNKMLDKGTLKV